MRFEIKTLFLAVWAVIVLAGCGRPEKEIPDNPQEESKAAVYTAVIGLSGDTDLFLCNGSFFALPADYAMLYDADGSELMLKNGIYYAEDMGSFTIRTSDKAEYFCGRLACVIKDTYSGSLVITLDLLKNDHVLFSKKYSIRSYNVGASIFFESDGEDVSFELMNSVEK